MMMSSCFHQSRVIGKIVEDKILLNELDIAVDEVELLVEYHI